MGRSRTRTVALFAAHPHDEFALAATLRRHVRAGDDVWLAWFARDDRPDVDKRRRSEALDAAGRLGIGESRQLFAEDLAPIALAMQLPDLVGAVERLLATIEPGVLYCPAFEGGHPDHDALNFAVFECALRAGVECREFPLYHRDLGRRLMQRVPHFADMIPGASEVRLERLTPEEIGFKRDLWSVYRTQHPTMDLLLRVAGDSERFFATEQTRPLPLRDYEHPPHEPPVLYEKQSGGRFPFSEFAEAVRSFRRADLERELSGS